MTTDAVQWGLDQEAWTRTRRRVAQVVGERGMPMCTGDAHWVRMRNFSIGGRHGVNLMHYGDSNDDGVNQKLSFTWDIFLCNLLIWMTTGMVARWWKVYELAALDMKPLQITDRIAGSEACTVTPITVGKEEEEDVAYEQMFSKWLVRQQAREIAKT